MNTSIAVSHARLGDLLDLGLQYCPVRTPTLAVVTRPHRSEHRTGQSDQDLPDAAHIIHHLPPTGRHSFLLMASCPLGRARDSRTAFSACHSPPRATSAGLSPKGLSRRTSCVSYKMLLPKFPPIRTPHRLSVHPQFGAAHKRSATPKTSMFS